MRLRVEAKLRKAIRRAEHRLPGLHAAIARHERQGAAPAEALGRFAADPAEKWDGRKFVASLLWKTPGTEDVCLSMVRLVASSQETNVLAEYISLWPAQKDLHPTELNLFQKVIAIGSPEQQMRAVDSIAFISRRPVRRALIEILNDTAAPLEVRERATEMLHLQVHRETAEACARALADQNAGIRFWAAYTLGQITFFRSGLREIVASALESVLDDDEVAPGWWSVGREAQAMIVGLRNDPGERERLQAETRRILQDANASAEDRRWAECYCDYQD